MMLIEDKGQKDGQHEIKHAYWEENDVKWEQYPLPVGDYIEANEKVFDMISRKQKRGVLIKKADFYGTYSVTVDTKRDMQEICGNICGSNRDHGRFRDECIAAQNNNIKLYVLVENKDGIQTLDDASNWINPRLTRYESIKQKHEEGKWKSINIPTKPPTSGQTLAKSMATMQKKYGVEFVFCTPEEAGKRVLELLKGEG